MTKILTKRDNDKEYVTDCTTCGSTYSFKERNIREYGETKYTICPNCICHKVDNVDKLQSLEDWQKENKQ